MSMPSPAPNPSSASEELKVCRECRECRCIFTHPNPLTTICDSCWDRTFEWLMRDDYRGGREED